MKTCCLSLALLLLACTPATPAAPEEAAPTEEVPAEAESAKAKRAGEEQARFVEYLRGLLAPSTDRRTIQGQSGWLYFQPELSSLTVEEIREPLAAILDFHRQLQERGVELLFAPIPAKAAVYPDHLPGAPTFAQPLPRLDTVHGEFLETLREQGVPVVDLLPLFLEHRDDTEGAMHCRQDTHFSGRATVLIAHSLAELVRQRAWWQEVETGRFEPAGLARETRQVTIEGDLRRELPPPQPAAETLSLTFVGRREGDALLPIPPDRDSPILLLGDSHTLVFHTGGDLHAKGAGLVDQLAFELGMPLDLIGVRGSGATSSRVNLLRRGGVEGKKLVIWVLTARELTEGDWKQVPVSR